MLFVLCDRPDRQTKTLHMIRKMATAQVVEASVTNNSLSSPDYPHPDDHIRQTTDDPVQTIYHLFYFHGSLP